MYSTVNDIIKFQNIVKSLSEEQKRYINEPGHSVSREWFGLGGIRECHNNQCDASFMSGIVSHAGALPGFSCINVRNLDNI